METIIINLKNGNVETRADVFKIMISGNYLIINTKKTEENGDEDHIIATNEIFDLADIINYTTKIKTVRYGNY